MISVYQDFQSDNKCIITVNNRNIFQQIKMSDYSEVNISFAGCGFIGIYHVGVSICLQKYAPDLLRGKIGGSSAGAMCALALTSGVSLVEVTRLVAELASEATKHKLGPLSPRFSLHQKLKDT